MGERENVREGDPELLANVHEALTDLLRMHGLGVAVELRFVLPWYTHTHTHTHTQRERERERERETDTPTGTQTDRHTDNRTITLLLANRCTMLRRAP